MIDGITSEEYLRIRRIPYNTINCSRCIDCQRMVDITNGEISWRCYGKYRYGELKKDIRRSPDAPWVSPDWCPHRK